MPSRDGEAAIRTSVASGVLDHVHHIRLSGDGAFDALDRLVPADLRVRDGQLLHTLLLDEEGHCFADLYVANDDEQFLLLAEGPTREALDAHLRTHLPSDASVSVDVRTESHAIVALEGPYAWELLGLAVGQEAIGLPYLTFFHLERWTCYRAGKTGEYGYGIILPRADLDDLQRRLHTHGAGLDMGAADLAALDQCALENQFFNIRREGREPVTPIELQLQWRVSSRKEYVGSGALRRRREEGARVRTTCLIGAEPWAAGDEVTLQGTAVGRLVNAGFSSTRGDWIAVALVDVAWAHPGIDEFVVVARDGRRIAARSVSAPVLNNRSLHVSPQMHSYGTRDGYAFPPLPRG